MEIKWKSNTSEHSGSFEIKSTGEGIVWTCVTPGWEGSRYWFKTKGDEHKNVTQKEKVPIDVERVNNIKELVKTVIAEPRLLQGIDNLRMMKLAVEKKNLGTFIKWVYDDVIKEELETITKNGFTPKDISGELARYSREWFIDYEAKQLGL